jgi:hypothetical protein
MWPLLFSLPLGSCDNEAGERYHAAVARPATPNKEVAELGD